MTSPPPTKSLPATAGPPPAPQPVDTTTVSEPKCAARQGVRTALRPDRFPKHLCTGTPAEHTERRNAA